MKFASLNDLYLQQLKDLHSAESQLIKALPKMAKAARNPDLKNAFIEHLEQTKGHLERLNQVAEKLGKRLAGHTCAAMKGLIEEGSEWIGEDAEAEVMDAGIIAAAQRVEHYEMAGYGTRAGLPALRIRTGRVATSSEGEDSGSGVSYYFRQQLSRNGRPLRF